MSLFTDAIVALKSITDSLGITDKKMPAVTTASKTVVPLSNPDKVAPNQDTYKQGTGCKVTQERQVEKPSYDELKQSVLMKIRKEGIVCDLDSFLREVAGINSRAEFMALNEEEKYLILEGLNAVIDSYVEDRNRGVIEGGKDAKTLIVDDAKAAVQAVESGQYKDARSYVQKFDNKGDARKITYDKHGHKIHGQQLKDNASRYRKQSNEEFAAYKAQYAENLKAKGVSEETINTKLAELDELRKLEDKSVFNRVFRITENSELENIVQILGNEVAHGIELGLSAMSDIEERTKIADRMDVVYTLSLIDECNKNGDKLESKDIQNTVQASSQYMSYSGLKCNESVLYNLRKNGNSSILPKCLNDTEIEEMFTAMSSGIGAGAILNQVLTSEQKSEFLSTWTNHAKEFGDYERVINNVNATIKEYISSHPNVDGIEKIKEFSNHLENIITEINNAKFSTNETNDKNNYRRTTKQNDNQSNDNDTVTIRSNKSGSKHVSEPDIKPQPLDGWEQNPVLRNINNKRGTKTNYSQNDIIQKATNYGVETAINECGLIETVEAIINNKNCKHLRPLIAHIIKNLDYNTLNNMAQSCNYNGHTFNFLYDNANKNVKYEFFEKNKNKLDYDTRTIIENKQDQENKYSENYGYELI